MAAMTLAENGNERWTLTEACVGLFDGLQIKRSLGNGGMAIIMYEAVA